MAIPWVASYYLEFDHILHRTLCYRREVQRSHPRPDARKCHMSKVKYHHQKLIQSNNAYACLQKSYRELGRFMMLGHMAIQI